jgi:hypothetical protein
MSLLQLGEEIEITPEDKNIARDIFASERPATPYEMENPGVVLQLQALLEQYDYDFLDEAKKIRNFVVARLLEESQDSRKSIRALELLGKITDVGLFMDRKEVLITHRTTEDLERQINDTLTILLQPEDVTVETVIPTAKPKLSKPVDIDVDDI